MGNIDGVVAVQLSEPVYEAEKRRRRVAHHSPVVTETLSLCTVCLAETGRLLTENKSYLSCWVEVKSSTRVLSKYFLKIEKVFDLTSFSLLENLNLQLTPLWIDLSPYLDNTSEKCNIWARVQWRKLGTLTLFTKVIYQDYFVKSCVNPHFLPTSKKGSWMSRKLSCELWTQLYFTTKNSVTSRRTHLVLTSL